MIAVFNQGLSSEISYEIDSCGNLLTFIPERRESITIMKQLSASDPLNLAQNEFSELLKPDYVISTITILNDYSQIILHTEGYQLELCNTQLDYTNQRVIGKFAALTFIKN